MKTLPKILLALTGVAALSLGYPASVQAVRTPTTYQYTGTFYTEVRGQYTKSMFVTVMFTVPQAIQANAGLLDLHPTAYTFSDGVQILDNATPDIQITVFDISTQGVGDRSHGGQLE